MSIRFSLFATLLLSGCQTTYFTPDQAAQLRNPLYAEQYAEQLVNAMVNLEIHEDPLLEEEDRKKIVDAAKEQWLAVARDARAAQQEGLKGNFIPMGEDTGGEVLYVQNVLHLGPQFFVTPGPSLHLWLTTAVDPRDVEFPDASAMDLGALQSMLGAQSYPVPEVEDPRQYRTVVLWDNDLNRLSSFAQMTLLFQ